MFPETIWSQVLRAKQGGAAVSELLAKYRTPILRFIEASGRGPEDAEDLTQEVLVRLSVDEVLQKADRSKGRFRSFLLGVTKNVLSEHARADATRKRGGDRPHVSLDAPVSADRSTAWVDTIPADNRDEGFDRLWVESLVKEALGRFRAECEERSQPHFEILRLHLEEGLSHAQAADRTGNSVENVRAIVSRARRRLGEILSEVVREYSSSPQEAEEELAYLSRFISPGA